MRTNLRTQKQASAGPGDLDVAIVQVLGQHGPQDALSLLARVKAQPGAVVARVTGMVVARRVRVDDRGRFTLVRSEQ